MGAGWGLGGILGAGLGLIVLEVVVTNPNAYGGVAALLQLPGQWAAGWLDPATPLIKAGNSSSSSSSTPASAPASAPFAGGTLNNLQSVLQSAMQQPATAPNTKKG